MARVVTDAGKRPKGEQTQSTCARVNFMEHDLDHLAICSPKIARQSLWMRPDDLLWF